MGISASAWAERGDQDYLNSIHGTSSKDSIAVVAPLIVIEGEETLLKPDSYSVSISGSGTFADPCVLKLKARNVPVRKYKIGNTTLSSAASVIGVAFPRQTTETYKYLVKNEVYPSEEIDNSQVNTEPVFSFTPNADGYVFTYYDVIYYNAGDSAWGMGQLSKATFSNKEGGYILRIKEGQSKPNYYKIDFSDVTTEGEFVNMTDDHKHHTRRFCRIYTRISRITAHRHNQANRKSG